MGSQTKHITYKIGEKMPKKSDKQCAVADFFPLESISTNN